MNRLLAYFLRRFKNAGGIVRHQKINSFREIGGLGVEFDMVVNCTGLGAAALVVDERDLYPVRGQVTRVKAPWLYQVVLDDNDDGNYVIPKYVCNNLTG